MTTRFLEDMSHMEKLEAIVHEKSKELLMYKAFLHEKGHEEEFNKRLAEAREKANEAHYQGI